MDISKYDNTINNAMFLTKVDNIFVMLYSSIMKRNLDTVSHKVTENVLDNYKDYVETLKNNKEIQMYGELNVKSSDIIDIEEDENYIIVKVELVSRYLNYIIDEDSLKIKRGVNNKREEHVNILTLIKRKNAKELSPSRHCPSCGALMDISREGKCTYCGTIFNTKDYDYLLSNIETI